VYALMLGQCSETTLKQKLSAQGSWETVDTAQDPNRLLALIDRMCMTPGMFTRAERMHSAMQTYYFIKRSRMESLGDSRRRFDAAQASMRQSGVDAER
jgi:hypothetical protein